MGNNTLLLVIGFVFVAFGIRALKWYLTCREVRKMDMRFIKTTLRSGFFPYFSKYELKVTYGNGQETVQTFGASKPILPVPKNSSIQVFLNGEAYSDKFQVEEDSEYNVLFVRILNFKKWQIVYSILMWTFIFLLFFSFFSNKYILPNDTISDIGFGLVLLFILIRVVLSLKPPRLEFKAINYCNNFWRSELVEI